MDLSRRAHHAYTQEVGTLVLLTVVSYGTYPLYWFYRNWTHLKEVNGHTNRPALRTLGLFIPFLNIFLIAQQLQQIRELSDTVEQKPYYPSVWVTIGLLGLGYLWVGYTIIAIALFSSEVPPTSLEAVSALLIDLIMAIFVGLLLAAPQRALNSYWHTHHKDRPEAPGLSRGEIAWIVIGSMVWTLSLAQAFLFG